MSDTTRQTNGPDGETSPATQQELSEESLEAVSGGIIDGPTCFPPFPDETNPFGLPHGGTPPYIRIQSSLG